VNHHFHKLEIDLKNNYTSWKNAYMEKKKLYKNLIKIIIMVMNGIINKNKWFVQKCVIYKHERCWTIWLNIWKPYAT
jgi:hypothetical protein